MYNQTGRIIDMFIVLYGKMRSVYKISQLLKTITSSEENDGKYVGSLDFQIIGDCIISKTELGSNWP